MRLSRPQSIAASIGILVIFFVGLSLLRPSSPTLPNVDLSETAEVPQTPDTESAETATSPEFVLDNFHRQEVKGGKKIWEVQASKGRYNPAGGRALLDDATMWLFQSDGGQITLKADKASLLLEGGAILNGADFNGNVVIVQDGKLTLETEEAQYDKAKDIIIAPKPVKISGDKINLEGLSMEVTVSTKEVRLLQKTSTILEPKAKNSTPAPTN